jgi:hypothetical protein
VEAAIPMGITTVRDAPRAAPAPAITLDTNDLLIAGRRRKYDNVGFVLAVNLRGSAGSDFTELCEAREPMTKYPFWRTEPHTPTLSPLGTCWSIKQKTALQRFFVSNF